MFRLDKLNQMIKELSFYNFLFYNWEANCTNKKQQATIVLENKYKKNKYLMKRSEIAHFCEHNGIYIHFTKARSTWHALAPCALKPWWLFLKPLRMKRLNENTQNAHYKI